MHLHTSYLWQRNQKYTVEKTVSLTIGAEKTGQQPEKEWNYNTFQHYTQNKPKVD